MIGPNDILNQPMPDNIAASKLSDADTLYAAKPLNCVYQPAALARRQVNLGGVTGNNHF